MCHLHTKVFLAVVLLNGIGEIKRNYAFIILRVFYLAQMPFISSCLWELAGLLQKGSCILFSVYLLANIDSTQRHSHTKAPAEHSPTLAQQIKKMNNQTQCHEQNEIKHTQDVVSSDRTLSHRNLSTALNIQNAPSSKVRIMNPLQGTVGGNEW